MFYLHYCPVCSLFFPDSYGCKQGILWLGCWGSCSCKNFLWAKHYYIVVRTGYQVEFWVENWRDKSLYVEYRSNDSLRANSKQVFKSKLVVMPISQEEFYNLIKREVIDDANLLFL